MDLYMIPERNWYILNTVGGSEEHASDWLIRWLGAEVYFPRQVRIRYKRRRRGGERYTEERISAAFKGYIFVKFPMLDVNWMRVKECSHITALFVVNGEPWRVSECFIDEMRKREARDEFRDEPAYIARMHGIAEGAAVTIPHGPFASFPAIVRAIEGHTASLAVWIFGRETMISFPVAELVHIDIGDKL